MADAPLPDEYAVPPPDPEDDVDSRNVSDLDDDDSAEIQQRQQGSEDEDGEDLLENMEGDYRAMPALDRYEDADLDDNVTDGDLSYGARLAAERELDRRDAREGRVTGRRRLPGALEEDLDDEDRRPSQRRRIDRAQAGDDSDMEPMVDLGVDLDLARGTMREYVEQEVVQREIGRRFQKFLREFQDENGEYIYRQRIRDMCTTNKQSLEVSYQDLSERYQVLAVWIADVPRVLLEIFHKAAREVVLDDFPDFSHIHSEIYVRMAGLPITDQIRDLRQGHLNKLVKVEGVCTRRTAIFPQLEMVKFDCNNCQYTLGPFLQNSDSELKLGSCPNCQGKGPFSVNVQETVYRNYQKITVQESPGTVPAGRLPRQKDVILLHDLIDSARPGEQVTITGIYTNSYDQSLNVKNGFPVFSTVLEANSVGKAEDEYAAFKLTDEDKQDIHRLARDPRIGERICKSIAPSIYGHANIKMALALALFGGQEKNPSGTHRLRGDINILLLGDPGTAKSQFLKYVEKTAQRAIYTTGKGASAVGLTASVQKDPITREWTLEGGALVLADKGVCLIDEFDKMNDQDRVSIHEAMEQQSISISKAGIVTSLQARCSVIAAANPAGGRYDPSRTFAENVELSDPILSRFDVLCVVRDTVDAITDEKLADFVTRSHMRSHPDVASAQYDAMAAPPDPDMLTQDMLRKYVTYAKMHCHPKLQNADYDKIAQVYADLRRESAVSHGMPIAVRHLESIIRMSEAHAAMHLREYVNDDDVDTAIRVLLGSFISTQKMSVQKALSNKFKKYLSYKADFVELLMAALQGLAREYTRFHLATAMSEGMPAGPPLIPLRALEEKAREYNIQDLQPLFDSSAFSAMGFRRDPDRHAIICPM